MSAKPVVYFIDDSATMREVIKIAFRRENLDVITCHDASSAMDMMDHSAPDVVISDVIMPGHDGYEVCQYIKQHPRFGQTPVILMSGVVNKGVAERAFAVHANELIRKPFQPQDLIARVRHLLKGPVEPDVTPAQAQEEASAVLSSIFSGPMPARVTIAIAHDRTGAGAAAAELAPAVAFDCRHRGRGLAAARGGASGRHSGSADHRLPHLPVPPPLPGRVPSPPRTGRRRRRPYATGNVAAAEPGQEAGAGTGRRA